MGHDETISIALTAQERDSMQAAVAAGDYDSPSAILHEALADWQSKRALELPDAAWLRAAWEEGLASGEPVPFDPEAIRARLYGRGG